jgi:hypothetical protein
MAGRKHIDQHIRTITELDVSGLEKTRKERARLEALQHQWAVQDLEPARKAGKAIKSYIRQRLDPHRVEFPGDCKGFNMFHAPPRLTVSVRFEVWPRLPGSGGYMIPARPILSGSIGAKDAAQLDELLTALKGAADTLASALFKVDDHP